MVPESRPMSHSVGVITTFVMPHMQNVLGDLFGGELLARDPTLVEELEWWSNAAGLNGSAFDASQILRGLRTLPLRLDRMEANATRIAEWLSARSDVQTVHYPGLKTSNGHEIAAAQQSGPGFMLSFQLSGGKPAADRFGGGS